MSHRLELPCEKQLHTGLLFGKIKFAAKHIKFNSYYFPKGLVIKMNGIAETSFTHLDEIREQTRAVFDELMAAADLEEGDILVVGCSSSEVASHKIGSYSSAEIGKAIFDTLHEKCREKKLYLAAQCCEHLNRALIIEKKAAKEYRFPMVNVVPQLKAGGSFATAAYGGFECPAVVEELKAHAGIDIGDTLIGMHLRPVAVPVRTATKQIGEAHVVCARTRLKYIGGERAAYKHETR